MLIKLCILSNYLGDLPAYFWKFYYHFGIFGFYRVFQHFINDVFEDVIDKFVFYYIDDIIVFSINLDTHYCSYQITPTNLWKSEICEFFFSLIDFLGHKISSDGIFMEPNNFSSILQWPTLITFQFQSVLGFINY